MATADASAEKSLFGHPRGLTFLFTTEMWERFSYYGMRAILILYLTNFLLLHPDVQGVIGYHPIKHAFEWLAAFFIYMGQYIWHWISIACFALSSVFTTGITLLVATLIAMAIGYVFERRPAPTPGSDDHAVTQNRQLRWRPRTISLVLIAIFGGAIVALSWLGLHGTVVAPTPRGLSIQNMGVQPFSSLIYGNYTAFVYLTPFFGGLVADRILGQRLSVVIGGLTMAVAEFTLMSPRLFFIGLFLLIIGNGFFKPNISTQVGNLYKAGDARIDRAYSIFYVGINVGAFFSPLVCGSLGEYVGYHWGFFAAGVGMLIGQVIYFYALRNLPPDRITRLKSAREEKKKLTGQEWKAVFALILLCIPTSLFWAVYEQQGNTMSLWAQNFTNRVLIPGVIDWQIPVTWFQAFNPFMIWAFTPLVIGIWALQAKRSKEPSTVSKMALGNFMLALSYVVMAAAAYFTGPAGHASWLWLFAFFAVITIGELYLSPIGLALVARVAPAKILSMMMGLWFITSFIGNQLQGVIGSFFSQMDKIHFFLLCAGIGAVAAGITWLFERPLRSILETKTAVPVLVTAEPQADPHVEPLSG